MKVKMVNTIRDVKCRSEVGKRDKNTLCRRAENRSKEIKMIVRVWEGLGNQLFQYAYARSLKEKGYDRVYLECRRIYRSSFKREDFSVERAYGLKYFNISLKAVNLEKSLRWKFLEQKTLTEKIRFRMASHRIGHSHFASDYTKKCTHFEFQPSLYSFGASTYVMGHFLNIKYFEGIRPILLKELQLKKAPKIPGNLRELFKERNTVSIHIRRTDFIKRGHCISYDRYYIRAMDYIKAHVENPCFLFFSDDMEGVKNNYGNTTNDCYFVSDGKLKDYEELALMYRCKHNIIANSTFSFWGAWLNDNPEKIVIAPQKFGHTFIPKEWIKM